MPTLAQRTARAAQNTLNNARQLTQSFDNYQALAGDANRENLVIDYRRGDVVWTTNQYDNSEGSEAIQSLPYIHLIEYEQQWAQTLAQITEFFKRAFTGEGTGGSNSLDAYSGMYFGTETKNQYILPFFSEHHHKISQSWNMRKGVADKVKATSWLEIASKHSFPGTGIVYPKSYEGGVEETVVINFELYNTLSRDADGRDVETNWKFINQLIFRNLHAQDNFITQTPPCLYEALIPGIKYIPVCVVSGLEITNIGSLNPVKSLGFSWGQNQDWLIPDGWRVSISLQEIIKESRNTFVRGIQSSDGGVGLNGISSRIKAIRTT